MKKQSALYAESENWLVQQITAALTWLCYQSVLVQAGIAQHAGFTSQVLSVFLSTAKK